MKSNLSLGIKLFVLNEEDFGRMLSPATSEMSLEDDQIAFTDAKIDWMGMRHFRCPLFDCSVLDRC